MYWLLLPTGWAQIVLNLRTGEFFPAEPVGFWTSGFRWGLGHGLAESPSKTRSRKSYWCGRKKLARLSVHGPCTGVHLVCSVQLRTLNREFPYIMMLGLSVRSRLQTILVPAVPTLTPKFMYCTQSDHDSEARFGICGQKWSRNELGKF